MSIENKEQALLQSLRRDHERVRRALNDRSWKNSIHKLTSPRRGDSCGYPFRAHPDWKEEDPIIKLFLRIGGGRGRSEPIEFPNHCSFIDCSYPHPGGGGIFAFPCENGYGSFRKESMCEGCLYEAFHKITE